MRRQVLFLVVVALGACKITKISRDGPTPKPTAVARADQGFPAEAVLCGDLGGTLVVSGTGFSPMPTDVLADAPGVALPTAVFRSADGSVVAPYSTTYDRLAETLTIVPEIPMPAGVYDIVVKNPNGHTGTLADALVVVPPPTVTSVVPATGPNNVTTPIDVYGTAFRAADDGTQPGVTLTPAGGGTTVPLGGVALKSDTDVGADVVPGLTVGVYDLTLTNPEGCSATLPNAFTVTQPPVVELCGSVDPAFGWVNGRTTLEICANNAAGHGLIPVPEVFLLVDPDGDGQNVTEVPLIREAFLSASTTYDGVADRSVMSAVVPSALEARGAGIQVGGPYGIKVVNPDGAEGIIANAFEVLTDPPPRVLSISPEQGETGRAVTMHIIGENLKDPATAVTPRLARVLFLTADLAAGATCAGPVCFECASPAVIIAGTAVDCAPPTSTMGAGSFLVRYEHLDDGSYADFAAFALTNPSGNLASATVDSSEPGGPPVLRGPRYAHGAAFARDDVGNRFMYVVGGQSGIAVTTALDTVEVASIDRFGGLSSWAELPIKLPKKLTGHALVAYGGYLFLVGGQDDAGVIQSAVYRARVLGSDAAPVIGPPLVAVGSLAAGTWSYRVSAVMGSGTDNDGGESLPSDFESIRLPAIGGVTLTWATVPGAASYRVYRTVAANDFAGSEVLLAEGVTAANYTDDGSATPGTVQPLPSGGTGVWMAMPFLATGRKDLAATIAGDSAGRTYLYAMGGLTPTSGPDPVNTWELGELILSGSVVSIPSSPGFVAGNVTMDIGASPRPRAELVALTLNDQTAPLIAGLNQQYVVAAQGLTTGSAVFVDITMAKVGTDGQLGAFATADSSMSADRYGAAAFMANNFLFSIGGRGASGYDNKGKTGEVCPARNGTCATQDPPVLTWAGGDSGITLSVARYRPGAVYAAGFFYFTGGRSNATNVLSSCERGGYAQP